MSLESVIADLVVALNANTAALRETSAPAPNSEAIIEQLQDAAVAVKAQKEEADLAEQKRLAESIERKAAEAAKEKADAEAVAALKKEKAAAAKKAADEKKAAEAAAAAKTPEGPTVTVADIRAAGEAFIDANGMNNAPIKELAKKYGVERVTAAPVHLLPEILATIKAMTAALETSGV